MFSDVRIVKVGGSLYELPDLGMRLVGWLRRYEGGRVVLVPGGGPAADVVRTYDRSQRLGDEASHWLALRMLQVNAHFLARLLPQARIVATPCADAPLSVLDAFVFAQDDE